MLKKIFTTILITFPITNVYSTGIMGVTIADVLLIGIILFLIIDIIKKRKKIKIHKTLGIVSVYIILQLLVIALNPPNNFIEIIMSSIRLLLYYLTLAIFTKSYFDINFALSLYRKVAIFACFFLFLQIIAEQLIGIYMPGTIPGLPIAEGLMEFNIEKESGSLGRARSIFLEPSHFAIYIVLILGIDLLNEEKINKKRIIVYTLGLLMSGSSTAIIMVAIIYLLYFLKNMRKYSLKKIFIFLIVMIFIGCLMPIYTNTESFKTFYDRTFVRGNATEGRFGNYSTTFKELRVWGNGLFVDNETDGYLSAFERIYVYFGIIGLTFFVILSIKNFINLKGIQWTTWVILFILIFPTEIIFGRFILLYEPFIINEDERKIGN